MYYLELALIDSRKFRYVSGCWINHRVALEHKKGGMLPGSAVSGWPVTSKVLARCLVIPLCIATDVSAA